MQGLNANIDLVIFDCDGVLVDSEALACVVHADVLTRHGYAITAEQVHARFLGRSAREARLEVESELGFALPETYIEHLRSTIDRVFDESLKPVPHITDVLTRLSQRVCVASSGTPTRIRRSLGTAGLLDHFAPHLFSAMQVERGKPAPDLFLFAAAQMETPPARCVVVEDSVPGVTAAHACVLPELDQHGPVENSAAAATNCWIPAATQRACGEIRARHHRKALLPDR